MKFVVLDIGEHFPASLTLVRVVGVLAASRRGDGFLFRSRRLGAYGSRRLFITS